jgi:hypothetical protein
MKAIGFVLAAAGSSDSTAPTVTITSTASGATAAAFTATFTFSEAVIGFDATKITVVNGSAGAVAGTGPYTSVITPTATGTVTVQVEANKVTDAALNNNTASNTFSILYVSARLWLKADAGVFTDDAATTPATADGNVIAVWQDQSGNGYHTAQTDNTKRPLLKLAANGINSRPTILFDGTNDILTNATANWLSSDSQGAVFAVLRMTTALKTDQVFLASTDQGTAALHIMAFYSLDVATTSEKIKSYQNDNGTVDKILGNTVMVAGTVYLLTMTSSGTAYAHRVNGANQTLTISSGANSGDWFADTANRDNFTIGAAKWTSEQHFLKGSIAELIVLSANVTGAALTAVESYLNTRYAAF